MVVTSCPSISAPSTKHELTSRPSSSTLHAPQLPSLQPSLVPVRLSTSRRHSSRLCRGSHRNSTSSPLRRVATRIFSGLLATASLLVCCPPHPAAHAPHGLPPPHL